MKYCAHLKPTLTVDSSRFLHFSSCSHLQPELGSVEKPEEIFHIIEHFCLGRRRLHLFGTDNTIRPGKGSLGTRPSKNRKGGSGKLTGVEVYTAPGMKAHFQLAFD